MISRMKVWTNFPPAAELTHSSSSSSTGDGAVGGAGLVSAAEPGGGLDSVSAGACASVTTETVLST